MDPAGPADPDTMIVLHLLAALALPASFVAVALARAASVLDEHEDAESLRYRDLRVSDIAP